MLYEGFVARLSGKDVVSKRTGKKLTAYSVKLEKADGTEYEEWIDFGFDEPPFQQGDYINVEAELDGKYLKYKKGTGTVVKNPPARAAAKPTAAAASDAVLAKAQADASGPTVSGPARGASGAEGPGPGSGTDRQSQIVAQHSQEIALRRLAIFLEHDALPMTEAKTKAGTSKRFDELSAMLHKFEVEAYNDVTAGRIATGAVLAVEGENAADKAANSSEETTTTQPGVM